jgi:hypothetical protein
LRLEENNGSQNVRKKMNSLPNISLRKKLITSKKELYVNSFISSGLLMDEQGLAS